MSTPVLLGKGNAQIQGSFNLETPVTGERSKADNDPEVLGKTERQELKLLQSELAHSLTGERKLKQSGDKEWVSTFKNLSNLLKALNPTARGSEKPTKQSKGREQEDKESRLANAVVNTNSSKSEKERAKYQIENDKEAALPLNRQRKPAFEGQKWRNIKPNKININNLGSEYAQGNGLRMDRNDTINVPHDKPTRNNEGMNINNTINVPHDKLTDEGASTAPHNVNWLHRQSPVVGRWHERLKTSLENQMKLLEKVKPFKVYDSLHGRAKQKGNGQMASILTGVETQHDHRPSKPQAYSGDSQTVNEQDQKVDHADHDVAIKLPDNSDNRDWKMLAHSLAEQLGNILRQMQHREKQNQLEKERLQYQLAAMAQLSSFGPKERSDGDDGDEDEDEDNRRRDLSTRRFY